MLKLQRMYVHNNDSIEYYFVTFEPNMQEDIRIIDDIIYIKGQESFTNILYKTFLALKYIFCSMNKSFDYVIRTNISTIINYDNLLNYLSASSKINLYCGGKLEILKWQLQPYEISINKQQHRNDYYGLKYIQGIGIIFSTDIIEKLIEITDIIEYDIVDDVKIGLLIREYFPQIYDNIETTQMANIYYNDNDIYNVKSNAVFVRNRTNNRYNDLYAMRNSINEIYDIQYPEFDKTIYITHKTTDKLTIIKEQWTLLNPTYKVELYDDKRCLDFLSCHFGNKYCDIFNYIKDGQIKSDFFRCCLIYINGGIYVDADVKLLLPLDEWIKNNLDFATCISYNYRKNCNTYKFNPHFIVSRKYNVWLYNTIKKYEYMYDNKVEYSYWHWSVCSLFNIENDFDITVDNSIYIHNGKQHKKLYQFLIENCMSNNRQYNFTNIRDENGKFRVIHYDECLCTIDNKQVLSNFANKINIK